MDFYYDFYHGREDSDPSTWREIRVKMPANDPRHALLRFLNKKELFYTVETKMIQQIKEYIVTQKTGRTVVRFKEVRTISTADVHKIFQTKKWLP